MNIAEVKELITLVNDSELSLFEFKTEDCYLKMDKSSTRSIGTATAPTAPAAVPAVQVHAPQTVQPAGTAVSDVNVSAAKEEATAKVEEGYVVKSPIVGTFYLSPSPEKPAYTEIGKKVKKGDILCIIEAMKLMNEIECEVSGEVIEILAENESMVEFGQPLFRIRRD
ncbi:MAG: acetyl-CoA carboxylase biotin carboxyl carrier protein [Clostridiaceae bacterium]